MKLSHLLLAQYKVLVKLAKENVKLTCWLIFVIPIPDEEVLPGRKLPPECNAELHSDYDGAAVRWGLTHHKDSAYECCMSCLDQARRAKPGDKKCNIWVYCPSETGCYSPDIYEHKNGECWLKYVSLQPPFYTFNENDIPLLEKKGNSRGN